MAGAPFHAGIPSHTTTPLQIPAIDHTVVLVVTEHREVGGVEAKHTTGVRVEAQPLRGEDTQHVGVGNEQNVVAGEHLAINLLDERARAGGDILGDLTLAIVHSDLCAIGQLGDPIAIHIRPKRLGAIGPQTPIMTKMLAHLTARTALGAAIIPLSQILRGLICGKTGKLGSLPGTTQRTGIHTILFESIRKRLVQPFATVLSLLLADPSQRQICTSSVLTGDTPRRLPMPHQNQVSRLGGSIA